MKKRITISLLLIFLSTACSKEKTFCWKCAMFKRNSGGAMDLANPVKSTECNKTEKEIRTLEKQNTKTIKVYNGTNYETKTIQAMTCKLDQ